MRERGVEVGTVGWRYEAWEGTIYEEDGYTDKRWRRSPGKFAFFSVREYAETFPQVGHDGMEGEAEGGEALGRMLGVMPAGWRMSVLAGVRWTLPRWRRDGPGVDQRKGERNGGYLDAEGFRREVSGKLTDVEERGRLGLVVLRWPRLGRMDYARGRDWLGEARGFVERVREGGRWRCAVELGNGEWVRDEVMEGLGECGAGYVCGCGEGMPGMEEQWERGGERVWGMRVRLRPGVTGDAVAAGLGLRVALERVAARVPAGERGMPVWVDGMGDREGPWRLLACLRGVMG